MNIFQSFQQSFQTKGAISKLQSLESGLKKDEEYERAIQPIIEDLVKIGQPAVELLLKVLKATPRRRLQDSIAHVLGRIGDGRAVDPLVQLLSKRPDPEAVVVADALGELRDKRALDVLKDILNRGSSARPRAWRAAARAYEKISGESLDAERQRLEPIWERAAREEAEREWGERMRGDGSSLL
jgi:HEAT repeat protein